MDSKKETKLTPQTRAKLSLRGFFSNKQNLVSEWQTLQALGTRADLSPPYFPPRKLWVIFPDIGWEWEGDPIKKGEKKFHDFLWVWWEIIYDVIACLPFISFLTSLPSCTLVAPPTARLLSPGSFDKSPALPCDIAKRICVPRNILTISKVSNFRLTCSVETFPLGVFLLTWVLQVSINTLIATRTLINISWDVLRRPT